jgi:hypothetical protein
MKAAPINSKMHNTKDPITKAPLCLLKKLASFILVSLIDNVSQFLKPLSDCCTGYFLGCPTVCVTRAGAGGGTPSDWKNAEAKKYLESRQNPQRRVHALLARRSIQA